MNCRLHMTPHPCSPEPHHLVHKYPSSCSQEPIILFTITHHFVHENQLIVFTRTHHLIHQNPSSLSPDPNIFYTRTHHLLHKNQLLVFTRTHHLIRQNPSSCSHEPISLWLCRCIPMSWKDLKLSYHRGYTFWPNLCHILCNVNQQNARYKLMF